MMSIHVWVGKRMRKNQVNVDEGLGVCICTKRGGKDAKILQTSHIGAPSRCRNPGLDLGGATTCLLEICSYCCLMNNSAWPNSCRRTSFMHDPHMDIFLYLGVIRLPRRRGTQFGGGLILCEGTYAVKVYDELRGFEENWESIRILSFTMWQHLTESAHSKMRKKYSSLFDPSLAHMQVGHFHNRPHHWSPPPRHI